MLNESRRENPCFRGFRPGPTRTALCSHRRLLEALNFGFGKKRDLAIYVAKTKTLVGCAVTSATLFSHMQNAHLLMTQLR